MSRLFFICYDKDMKFNYDWNLKDGYPAKGVEPHHHTVMSTFACGGGSSMGYKLAGYDVVAANDIDPQMARIYQENHHPKQFFLCPVKELLNRDDLPEVDVLDGSPPCFVAGTQVLTKEGYKSIEDIKIGDYVWTHKGRFKRVYNTMNKQSDDVYAVNIQGSLPILVTGNHPFYAREMSRFGKKGKRGWSEPLWKEVKDLELVKNSSGAIRRQDYAGIPVNKNTEMLDWAGVDINHVIYGQQTIIKNKRSLLIDTPEFWFFIGRWVGDGWRRKDRKEVILCAGKHQAEDLKKIIANAGLKATITEERTTYRGSISNIELYHLLEMFHDGAENKHIPQSVLDLPDMLLNSFLDGYISADGYIEHKKDVDIYKVSSVSLSLILGVQAIVAKLFNQASTIIPRQGGKREIEGRTVDTKPSYVLSFRKDITKQQHHVYIDNCLWVPFKRKTKLDGKHTVYNISVEEDESYTVNNLAVHNCSTFSLAGSREKAWGVEKKFREGQAKQELDKLFFDFIDVAEKMRPKVVIAENVEGIIRGKAVKYVNAIVARFKKMGYNIDIFLCDGTNMGLPQMRRRVFFVANRLGKHLKLSFNEPPITFGQIRRSSGTPLRTLPYTTTQINYWHETKPGCPMGVFLAGAKKLALDKVPFTVASSSMLYDALECRTVYKEELDDISSFPHDYNYLDASPNYVQGMSVPPVMMAQVAYEVYKQLLSE